VLTPQKTFLPFEGALPVPDPERLASMTVQSKTVVPAS